MFNNIPALQKSGDDQALALQMAWGLVLEQFHSAREFYDDGTQLVIARKSVDAGKAWQFEWFGDMPDAEEFTPGDEMKGMDSTFDLGTITPDKPLTHHAFSRLDEKIMAHFDIVAPKIRTHGRKIAEQLDRRIAVTGVKAAQTAAVTKDGLTVHPGGNVVERVGTDLSGAYPATVAGAKALRDDAYQLARLQDEANVPKEYRFGFIPPYIKQVLFQDTTVFDKDLTNMPADINLRVFGRMAGYWLVESNNIPSTNITSNSSGWKDKNSKYQGDFTYNGSSSDGRPAMLTLCGARDGVAAVGMVEQYPLTPILEYLPRSLGWFSGAAMITGFGIMNPQCAGLLRVDDA